MSYKVIKKNGEVIIDYLREKNAHELRLKLLEFLVGEANGNVLLYINTNSKKTKVPFEKIKETFVENNIEFLSEIIENTGGGILRLGNFIKSRGNRKKIPEYLILADLKKDSALKDIYDNILMHNDYGLCINSNKSMNELIGPLRNDVSDVLFNKKIFDRTCYDSIVVKQMRIDSPSEPLEAFLNNSQ